MSMGVQAQSHHFITEIFDGVLTRQAFRRAQLEQTATRFMLQLQRAVSLMYAYVLPDRSLGVKPARVRVP